MTKQSKDDMAFKIKLTKPMIDYTTDQEVLPAGTILFVHSDEDDYWIAGETESDDDPTFPVDYDEAEILEYL